MKSRPQRPTIDDSVVRNSKRTLSGEGQDSVTGNLTGDPTTSSRCAGSIQPKEPEARGGRFAGHPAETGNQRYVSHTEF